MGDDGFNVGWRVCLDFGTAVSKASVCQIGFGAAPSRATVRPLAISAPADDLNPGVAPSALLFHDGRLRFGNAALTEAEDAAVTAEPLLSFKTFLSARDYDDALSMYLPRTIDESGIFRQRDAIVLYSAYLLALTDLALSQQSDLPIPARACPRRYTYPLWKAQVADASYMMRVLNEADAVRRALGEAMWSQDGVTMADASAALTEALKSPGAARVEAGVFEARAAAACHLSGDEDTPDHVMVFDMGAGTADIAAFGYRGEEIAAARRTSSLGCDELDKIIVALFMDRADRKAPRAVRKKFWRSVKRRARLMKQDLFAGQACVADFDGKAVRVTPNDLFKDRNFKVFRKDVTAMFQKSLQALAVHAAEDGAKRVGVVLAGGGSALPFVQQMAQKARPRGKIKRAHVAPIVPAWAQDGSFAGSLAPIFPQMAISIGGAAAPLAIAA